MNRQARFEYVDDYLDQFSSQKNKKFLNVRQQAATALETYGFPGLKTESWKYTNARSLLQHVYQPAGIKKN